MKAEKAMETMKFLPLMSPSEFVEVRYALSEAIKFSPTGRKRFLKKPDRKLCDEVPGQSICLGWYEPYKGRGLFWIYDVGYEKLRNLPSTLLRFPGEQRKTDQVGAR